ncbi:MAG: D-aminoacyl-tRNA deacylase [Candidatus Bilamarchaeaceae archaeon]
MPVILFTSNNLASRNIASVLIEKYDFAQVDAHRWERSGAHLIDTNASNILEIPTSFDTDYIIVLSSHKSRSGERMITAHFPGNWKEAEMGGSPRTLNIAYGSKLREFVKITSGRGWDVVIEADHHGPTPGNKAIIFVEIGSTESEWIREDAAEIVACGVDAMVRRRERYESVFGVGGGHYAKEFTKLVLSTEYAVGHIAPKYVLNDLDFELFKQAIEKNVEPIEKVFVLAESTNRTQKEKILEFASKLGVDYTEI